MRVPCPRCGVDLKSADRIEPRGTFSARVATCACGVTAMIARGSATGRPFVLSWKAAVPITVQVVR